MTDFFFNTVLLGSFPYHDGFKLYILLNVLIDKRSIVLGQGEESYSSFSCLKLLADACYIL